MLIYCSTKFQFLFFYFSMIKKLCIDKEFNKTQIYDAFFGDKDELLKLVHKPKLCVLLFNTLNVSDYNIDGYNITSRELIDIGELLFYERYDNIRNITFVIQGVMDKSLFPISICILSLYGKSINATWDKIKNFDNISNNIKENEWINKYNVFYQTYTTLYGLNQVNTEWVIKLRGDELYVDWSAFINNLQANPGKIICNNVYFYRSKRSIYHVSDHIIGGKFIKVHDMFNTCMNNLKSKKFPRFIRYAEQILTYSYLSSLNLTENLKANIVCSRDLLHKHYDLVPISAFEYYIVTSNHKGHKVQVSPNIIKDYKFITPIENMDQL